MTEQVVRRSLSPGLDVSARVDDDGDLVVVVADGSPRVAILADHGSGRFSLKLDDRWVFQEFE